ncbi:hypothetical protein PVAP13_3KG445001 [Panicum virgatum]|uniref:Uncharacterized protein n=1 Tax=Panicum virgatum TaxID=38727 RepID=A0A8T0V5A5_PANVG|nr:hypothetical protein PVAP13_3KG445001 [Panicum virgatum]
MPHAHLRRSADLRAAPPSAGAPLLSCWDAIWDLLPLHPSTGRQHPQRHDPRVVVALRPCGVGPAQPSVAAAACASRSSSAAALTMDPPPSTGALRLGPPPLRAPCRSARTRPLRPAAAATPSTPAPAPAPAPASAGDTAVALDSPPPSSPATAATLSRPRTRRHRRRRRAQWAQIAAAPPRPHTLPPGAGALRERPAVPHVLVLQGLLLLPRPLGPCPGINTAELATPPSLVSHHERSLQRVEVCVGDL